jgi:UDP-N-acetylglucosamine:LPS N-acetylglucosamine transferase
VELSQWADVMLVIGSSILIEALTLDKPVLYLKYLHANTTQYEEMGACWTIRNEDELKSALAALQQNPGSIPYASENVEQFLAEIIYGGHRHRDVLKDYEQFIVKGQPL